jgi:hypothetical protein
MSAQPTDKSLSEETDLKKMKPRVKKALRQVKLMSDARAKRAYGEQNDYGEDGEEQQPTKVKPKLAAGTTKPPTKSSQAKTAVGKRMALQPMKPSVAKAGEGSKGGDVVGHTRSGKPIYRKKTGMSPGEHAKAHPFTMDEHHEAAKRHHTEYNKAKVKWHADASAAHKEHAERARNRDKGRTFHKMKPDIKDSKKKAEKAVMKPNLVKGGKGAGSRGGNIIGHTSSGKPVYGPSAKHHKLAGDHHKAQSDHMSSKSDYPDRTSMAKTGVASRNAGLTHAHDKHKDFSGSDHREASQMLHRAGSKHHQAGEPAMANTFYHAAEGHDRMSHRKDVGLKGPGDAHALNKSEASDALNSETTTIEKSTSKENDMSENKLEDLFKSELGGDTEEHFTSCVHCSESLTKSDLAKGLSTHFIKDDNDQPSSGGKGQVAASRTGSGAKETDAIAPLLKGEDAGDDEEFYISKGEMDAMGMDTSDLQDGDHTITKGEMNRLGADQHIPYLRGKKVLSKSIDFTAGVQSAPLPIEAAPADVTTTPEHAAVPTAEIAKGGMAYGPGGGALVNWVQGDDEAIAKSIELNALGQGNDEPIRGL